MPRLEKSPPLKTCLLVLGSLLFVLWAVAILDTVLFRHALLRFGIVPRTLIGLRGILLAPLLHGNLHHIAANTAPLLVLGALVLLWGLREFWVVTWHAVLIGGLGVWALAPARSVHVGASGVLFGYFGYLVMRGWYERRFSSILMALLVLVLYGGILWGLRPFQEGVSWQGHLFGLVGGITAASRWGRK